MYELCSAIHVEYLLDTLNLMNNIVLKFYLYSELSFESLRGRFKYVESEVVWGRE